MWLEISIALIAIYLLMFSAFSSWNLSVLSKGTGPIDPTWGGAENRTRDRSPAP
jgi:hypothetical protein